MIESLNAALEISLLTIMVWREARGESFDAKLQVAWTVRNRVEHPKWWGKTFSEVITKKWQYSSISNPKDPQLTLYPTVDGDKVNECLGAAYLAYQRVPTRKPLYPTADSYFDDSIEPPNWATIDKFVGKIGRLNFYNVDSDVDAY